MIVFEVLREAAAAVLSVAALGAIFLSAWMRRQGTRTLAARVDAALPQTQCRQCGFDGCRPYAEAIAAGAAPINRCPPGGARVIRKLAAITGQPRRALDASCGSHKPRQIAAIDETRCIGCTLCIQACPVDAIIGAAKLMHTVIGRQCTGCELCLPPCPVDCIVLVPAPWRPSDLVPGRRLRLAAAARHRFERRKQRLERERLAQAARLASKAEAKLAALEASDGPADARKRAIVQAALARARAKLAPHAAMGRGGGSDIDTNISGRSEQ
jgi:electron transport complex protein RnfB